MITARNVVLDMFGTVTYGLCLAAVMFWIATRGHTETRAEAIERHKFDEMQMAFIDTCEVVRSRHDLNVARHGTEHYTRPWTEMTCVCFADRIDDPWERAKRHTAVTAMIVSFGEAESDPAKRGDLWATFVSHGKKAGLAQRDAELEMRSFYGDVDFCTKPRHN